LLSRNIKLERLPEPKRGNLVVLMLLAGASAAKLVAVDGVCPRCGNQEDRRQPSTARVVSRSTAG
jgi:hypothetical protein